MLGQDWGQILAGKDLESPGRIEAVAATLLSIEAKALTVRAEREAMKLKKTKGKKTR